MPDIPPKLSICVPTYNRSAVLTRCLESLRAWREQGTGPVAADELEIVVADNASTDGTPAVLTRFAEELPGLRHVRHRRNLGLFANLLAVSHHARGRYLYIVGDDDRPHAPGITAAIDHLESDAGLVAVWGAARDIHPDGSTKDELIVDRPTRFTRADQTKALGLFGWFHLPVLRRETYQRAYLPPGEGFAFEWQCYERLLAFGDALFVPDILLEKYYSDDNITSRIYEPWYQAFARGEYEAYLGKLNVTGIEQLIAKRLSRHLVHAMLYAIRSGKHLIARTFLLRARAYRLIADADVRQWEQKHLPDAAAEQLRDLFEMLPAVRTIVAEDDPRMREVLDRITDLPDDVTIKYQSPPAIASEFDTSDESVFVLTMAYAAELAPATDPSRCRALEDVLNGLRILPR